MIKRIKKIVLMISACVILAGCSISENKKTDEINKVDEIVKVDETDKADGIGKTDNEKDLQDSGLVYYDALGKNIEFTVQELADVADGTMKVAVLSGSYAEIWSLAGGKSDVVTEDAYDEGREITIDDTTVSAGSLKNPNIEILLASDVKIAMLSADIEGQVAIREQLEDMGIKTVFISVETFEDYLKVLKFFTELTGQSERYDEYGISVTDTIAAQIARQDDSHPTVLFLRAYSGGVKAKGSNSMTGEMLKELGCVNIADREQRMINDLSMEVILETNPDYIFLTVMGDEEAGLESARALLTDNPAWNDLTAVQEERYYILPQAMFHNKPNQRWGESYRMLADILYPEQETP